MNRIKNKGMAMLLAVLLVFSGCMFGFGNATSAYASEGVPGLEMLTFSMTTSPNCKLGEHKTILDVRAHGDEGSNEYDLIVPDHGIYYSTAGGIGSSSDRYTKFKVALPEESQASLKVNYKHIINSNVSQDYEVESDANGEALLEKLIENGRYYDEYFTVEIIPAGKISGEVYKVYIKPQVEIAFIGVTESNNKDIQTHRRPFEDSKTYINSNTIIPGNYNVTTDAVKGTQVTIVPNSYMFQIVGNEGEKPVYTMTVNGESVELTKNSSNEYAYTYTVPESGDTTFVYSAKCAGCVDSKPVTLILKSAEYNNYPTKATITATASETGAYTVNASVQLTASQTNDKLESGNLKYQWMSGIKAGNVSDIANATTNPYTVDTSNPAVLFYKCKISNVVDGRTYSITTGDATQITINGTTVDDPQIIEQPVSAEYEVGATATALSVTASGVMGGTLSYQWYKGSSADGSDAKAITSKVTDRGRTQTYTPSTKNEGITYYYCMVKDTSNKISSEEVKSEVATITVRNVDFLKGEGTESDPYLIENINDLNTLKESVNVKGHPFADTYFRLENNITLPVDWDQIGTTKDGSNNADYGKNMRPFSGIFDGNGKQITVAKGGKSLFKYVRSATIKNLDIYGEEIQGYGLIDGYTIDYGADGKYDTGCPDTVTIDHVTIKSGTKTLKSGFIGGFASGANNITITNCIAESDVTIGYNKNQSSIGTFAGSFNGTVINCKSAADVYGKSNVGGIIGAKGQSMGSCNALNCEFTGNVYATGTQAGGIIGSGYDGGGTAPNTPVVTIKNCLVAGNITGANRVGGILGAEPGCEDCWANGTGSVTDSVFCGKIEGTEDGAYVGGIVGFLKSYNEYQTVGDNYFLNTCGAKSGVGKVELMKIDDFDISKTAKAVSATALKGGSIVNKLNSSNTSYKNWIQGTGYPIHSSEPVMYAIELSGNYKKEYKTGEELSKEGMTITGKLSDGSTKAIELSDSELKFTGYNMNQRGVQTVTVTYGVAKATYEIRVLYSESQVKEVVAYITVLGDSEHKEATADGGPHTLSSGNLTTWIEKTKVAINNNTSVYDVIKTVLTQKNLKWEASAENQYSTVYISGVQMPESSEYLSEFTNGNLSGWMYTLNGSHPLLGVAQQFLNNGDEIVFHYTDDYTVEEGSEKWNSGSKTEETKTVTTDTTSGSTATTAPTETKVTEKVNADGTKEKTATVTVSTDNQTEIIKQATDKKSTEIVLEVASTATGGAQNVQLQLNVSFVKNVSEKTDAALTVNTENGTVSLDQDTIKTVLSEAKGATITLDVNKVEKPTEVQKKAAGESGQILSLTVKSGDKTISDFKTGKVTVTVVISTALQNRRVAAIHIAEDGKIEQMPGKSREVNGKKCYAFTTSHFSDFALVDADELGLETEDEIDAAALVAKLTPVARSAKTAKGSIKVTTSLDKSDKAIISDLKAAGYTVKYRFYRSTKKAAGYKSATTKKTTSYINTTGKKGTKYFYKVQLRVYDAGGKLAAKTALKQCKYAARTK